MGRDIFDVFGRISINPRGVLAEGFTLHECQGLRFARPNTNFRKRLGGMRS
jgi:hypothetical protein